ncbi:hypothetical protein EDC04DRAFT_864511 [Pisolithus marmoratus]|nr:hypothetical protein EDC04DRAFT_864511 [Pisolithus marmoratus]
MITEFGTQAADVPPATLELAHRMFDAACEGNPELLRAAIDALLPVNLTNDEGNMCLKLASHPNHPALVSDLLVRHADLNRVNDPRQSSTAMGRAPLPDSHRLSIDTNPLYLTGMWSWMATELLLAASGVWEPVHYKAHHDLESLFYVLLGISVLYDEPYKLKPEGELGECFNMYFNTSQPNFSKTITTQSQLG